RDGADDHHLLLRPALLRRRDLDLGAQGVSLAAAATRPAAGEGTTGPAAAPVLGLDIGGTKLAAGGVDAAGCVSSFGVAPTHAEEGPEPTLARLYELGRRAIEESAVPDTQIAA